VDSGKDFSVKIDNSVKTGSVVNTGSATRQSEAKVATTPATATPAAPDIVQVQLSPGLLAAEGAMAATPAVNSQRVAEIKQAIAEGRFTINADRIAAGLLDSVSQMLGARH
jgi:negative regulator of flagellin synthesis FlgM